MQIARKPRRRNTIVLTSLVDVLFVLLFFFMLVTRYGDWGSWSMALSGTATASRSDAGALVVELQRDGAYRLEGRASSFEAVSSRLSAPGTRAVLVAAPGVSLQAVIDTLDKLKPTGAAMTLGRAQAPTSK